MSSVVGSGVREHVLGYPQDDQVATTCHKLRTPLTAAMGFLQLAMRDARRSGSAPSTHLDMVDQQLRRIASMLDDLASDSRGK